MSVQCLSRALNCREIKVCKVSGAGLESLACMAMKAPEDLTASTAAMELMDSKGFLDSQVSGFNRSLSIIPLIFKFMFNQVTTDIEDNLGSLDRRELGVILERAE